MSQAEQKVTDELSRDAALSEEQIATLPAAGRDLFLVSTAHAFIHAVTVLMPLVYPLIQEEYHLSYTQIGLVVALPNALGGFLQVIFGLLSRYILRKVLLGIGTILGGLSTFFTGTINGFWSLLTWSTAFRLATAPQHPVGSSYLTDRYGQRRHGYALAWHIAGGNIGTLAVPFIAGPLLGLWGWRPLLYVAALPGILIGIAILILLEERGPLDRRHRARQQAVGNAPSPAWSLVVHGPKLLQAGLSLLLPLRDRTLLIIMTVSIIAAGGRGLGNVTTYVPLYLQNVRHVDSRLQGILLTLLLLGSVIGPLLGGRLSDRLGRRPMLYLFYGASVVTTLLFIEVARPGMPFWLIPPALLLMGLAVYAEAPLLQAYLADSASRDLRDNAFSLYFALAFGVGSAWGAIIGWLIDRFGFQIAFIVMALSYLLAGGLLTLIRQQPRANQC
ncbi:MFS transporter [Thermogemmatispora sp.]|uniref:MFS transporter n=1 Tax=Thermogemmatispora sp. TaxID=1968838 RepID=UPI001D61F9ED|nr:MFS transporter [Thermogemmatispora sp.]MBX5449911.1 MFS transporter [Thermogemmatispora sp.]